MLSKTLETSITSSEVLPDFASDTKDKSLTTVFMKHILTEKNSNCNTNRENLNELDNNKLTSSGFKNLNKNTVSKKNIHNEKKSVYFLNFKGISDVDNVSDIEDLDWYNPNTIIKHKEYLSFEETKEKDKIIKFDFDSEYYTIKKDKYTGIDVRLSSREIFLTQISIYNEKPRLYRIKDVEFETKEATDYYNRRIKLVEDEHFVFVDYLNDLENEKRSGIRYKSEIINSYDELEPIFIVKQAFFATVDVQSMMSPFAYNQIIVPNVLSGKITDSKNFKINDRKEKNSNLKKDCFIRTEFKLVRYDGDDKKEFRIFFSIVDPSKIAGNISLENYIKLVEFENPYKDTFSKEEKSNFFKLTIEDFKSNRFFNYALGDANIEGINQKFIQLMGEIYNDLGLKTEVNRLGMTLGGNLARTNTSMIIEKLGAKIKKTYGSKGKRYYRLETNVNNKPIKFTKKVLDYYIESGSIKKNREYRTDTRGYDGATGGLCLNVADDVYYEGAYCDIDLVSCYVNIQLTQDLILGKPRQIYYSLKDATNIETFNFLTNEEKEIDQKIKKKEGKLIEYKDCFNKSNIVNFNRIIKSKGKDILLSQLEKTEYDLVLESIRKSYRQKKKKVSTRIKNNTPITLYELFENSIYLTGLEESNEIKDRTIVDIKHFNAVTDSIEDFKFDVNYFISKYNMNKPDDDYAFMKSLDGEDLEVNFKDENAQSINPRSFKNVRLTGYDILELKRKLSPCRFKDFLKNCRCKLVQYYAVEDEIKTKEEFIEFLSQFNGKKSIDNFYNNNVECPYFRIPLTEITGKFLEKRMLAAYERKNIKKLDKKSVREEVFKLLGNTQYGDLVSKYFNIGNSITSNNITSLARLMLTMMIDNLGIKQAITDGGAFSLNDVYYRKLSIGKKGSKLHVYKRPLRDYINDKDVKKYSLDVVSTEEKNPEDSLYKDNTTHQLTIYYKDGTIVKLNNKEMNEYISKNSLEHIKNENPDSLIFETEKMKLSVVSENDIEEYLSNCVNAYQKKPEMKQKAIIKKTYEKGLMELDVKTTFQRLILEKRANYCMESDAFKKPIYKIRSVQLEKETFDLIGDEFDIEAIDSETEHNYKKYFDNIKKDNKKVLQNRVFFKKKFIKTGTYRSITSLREKMILGNEINTLTYIKQSVSEFRFLTYKQEIACKKFNEKLYKKHGTGIGRYNNWSSNMKNRVYLKTSVFKKEFQNMLYNELADFTTVEEFQNFFDKNYNCDVKDVYLLNLLKTNKVLHLKTETETVCPIKDYGNLVFS